MPKDHGIGASTKRREDVRFLTGRGNYTDDMQLHGQTYAVFVRSNVAHGRIKSINTARRQRAMPGVLAVFTGEDFKDVGGNPAGWLINSRDGSRCANPSARCWRMAKCAMWATPMPLWSPRPTSRPRMRPSNGR